MRPITLDDAGPLSAAFAALGWDKPVAQFEGYAREHLDGERVVLVAEEDGGLAGYCTLQWVSGYPPFRAAGVPEIVDLNVLPHRRRRGVATALMDALELEAARRSDVVGLGVGLSPTTGRPNGCTCAAVISRTGAASCTPTNPSSPGPRCPSTTPPA